MKPCCCCICADVDECENNTLNECEQICINSEPGYSCSCEMGFQLDVNERTCSGACTETFCFVEFKVGYYLPC